jgi:hypothetical protein
MQIDKSKLTKAVKTVASAKAVKATVSKATAKKVPARKVKQQAVPAKAPAKQDGAGRAGNVAQICSVLAEFGLLGRNGAGSLDALPGAFTFWGCRGNLARVPASKDAVKGYAVVSDAKQGTQICSLAYDKATHSFTLPGGLGAIALDKESSKVTQYASLELALKALGNGIIGHSETFGKVTAYGDCSKRYMVGMAGKRAIRLENGAITGGRNSHWLWTAGK